MYSRTTDNENVMWAAVVLVILIIVLMLNVVLNIFILKLHSLSSPSQVLSKYIHINNFTAKIP